MHFNERKESKRRLINYILYEVSSRRQQQQTARTKTYAVGTRWYTGGNLQLHEDPNITRKQQRQVDHVLHLDVTLGDCEHVVLLELLN